jgi:NitT/TauT family transport system substrate-binding protein
LTVAMQHPEAVVAMTSGGSQVSGYVSSSPFQEILLKKPGISKITDSFATFGGPTTLSVVYAKEAFVKNNPKVMQAFYAALREAFASIAADRSASIGKYLAVTDERIDRALIEATLAQPGCSFGIEPAGTLHVVELMHRVGLLKQLPMSWKDYFAEALHVGHGD